MQWVQLILLVALTFLSAKVIGQESDLANEDSPVLLTLTSGSDKEKIPEDDDILMLNKNDEPEKAFVEIGNDLGLPSEAPATVNTKRPGFFSAFFPSPAASARPSLFQSFLAGRNGAATQRSSPLVEFGRNLNITGRFSNFRQRLGRFRIPRLETNEKSFAYRAGRRVGLFFQTIGQRARALAERLRARAATATPTAT